MTVSAAHPKSPLSTLHSPSSILHSPFSNIHSPLSILHPPFSTLHSPPSPRPYLNNNGHPHRIQIRPWDVIAYTVTSANIRHYSIGYCVGAKPLYITGQGNIGAKQSFLRQERDCFPFAAAQGFGSCATQKLAALDCHSEPCPELGEGAAKSLAPTWAEMLRCAQHDSFCLYAYRPTAWGSTQKLGSIGCHSEPCPELGEGAAKSLAPTWAEMLRFAQHDSFCLCACRPKAWGLAMTKCGL